MRLRTAVVVTTVLGSVGALGVTVASGATPIWNTADLPVPELTLACPETLELGDAGPLSGSLSDAETGDPIARHTVQVTRSDEFGEAVPVDDARTANDGSFGHPLSDTPVNRGDQTYAVTFAGNDTYAGATATCDTDVHGTDTTLDAAAPTDVVAGQDVDVTGTLETATGEPVSGAPITATDTVDGAKTDLAKTSTSADGTFTVTVPSIAAGVHDIDISYVGDEVLEPSADQVNITLANDTTLTTEPLGQLLAGDDIEVVGQLETAAGEPISEATITATDSVDGGAATDLAETTTDSAGGFTLTVPSAVAGQHLVDISYAGDGPNKPATGQVNATVKHETMLTLTGPDELPAEPEDVNFTVKLTDRNGSVSGARVVLNDGGTWEQATRTDANGQATYTKQNVSNEVPLRIEVTYAEDATHWGASINHTWKATPWYSLTKDKNSYTAGDLASLTLTAPNGNLPATIELKPYHRPAVSITPSDTGETAVSRKLYRNSTLTISTEATDRWKAGTRTFTIRVAPRVNQTLEGSYDKSGETYLVRTTRDPRLDAKVLPARPGRCVKAVVQKYTDGSYRTVQTSSCRLLDVESTASFKLVNNPRPGARFRMRFVSPADEMNIAGHGDWTYVRFTS